MLRYARWAAVSTAEQAKKVSLDVQLQKGQETAERYGWIETHPPFVVPGESRTRFISLNHAEEEIEPLHLLLEAARRGRFDLLYVYDLNRFRNLMRQVFDALCDYNVQIYIGSYPRDPVLPEQYNEEQKAAVGMIVDLSGIISRSEINNLQKHYREKMPKRVTQGGLHAGTGKVPYGYRREGSGVYLPNEDAITAVQIKDMFLAGKSINQIKDHLNETAVKSPYGLGKWYHGSVLYILRNPYYAGIVTWGKRKSIRDRREGKTRSVKGTPVTNKGIHKALWDEQTYKEIMAELARRGKSSPGRKTSQLSRLLLCHCGHTMRVKHEMFYKKKGDFVWACSAKNKDGTHAFIRNSNAVVKFTQSLVEELQKFNSIGELPQPEDYRPALEDKRKDLETKKQRWLTAFENGELDAREYSGRVVELDKQIKAVSEEIDSLTLTRQKLEEKYKVLNEYSEAVKTLPYYILNGDPQEVNASLRALLKHAVIEKDGNVRVSLL